MGNLEKCLLGLLIGGIIVFLIVVFIVLATTLPFVIPKDGDPNSST